MLTVLRTARYTVHVSCIRGVQGRALRRVWARLELSVKPEDVAKGPFVGRIIGGGIEAGKIVLPDSEPFVGTVGHLTMIVLTSDKGDYAHGVQAGLFRRFKGFTDREPLVAASDLILDVPNIFLAEVCLQRIVRRAVKQSAYVPSTMASPKNKINAFGRARRRWLIFRWVISVLKYLKKVATNTDNCVVEVRDKLRERNTLEESIVQLMAAVEVQLKRVEIEEIDLPALPQRITQMAAHRQQPAPHNKPLPKARFDVKPAALDDSARRLLAGGRS
jgi:hypothetical protein